MLSSQQFVATRSIPANKLPCTVAEKYTFNASFVVGAVMDVDCIPD